jgi:hypothetical protein
VFDAFHVLLYLHVLGSVMALGPTFVFSIIGGLSAKEPQHGNFALRLSLAIQDRLVVPIALTLAVTGIGLFLTADPAISLAEPWLLASIALYVVAMGLSIGVARPSVIRLVALTAQPQPAPAAAAPAGAGESRPPMGPPPAVMELIRRQQLTGTTLSVLIVLILLLMVIQPGGAGA